MAEVPRCGLLAPLGPDLLRAPNVGEERQEVAGHRRPSPPAYAALSFSAMITAFKSTCKSPIPLNWTSALVLFRNS